MPIYEYVCEACGRLTEVMQKLGEAPPACPECGANRLAKLVSRTTFQLKGGGWYSDLYASPKAKPEGGPKPAATPAGAGKAAPAAPAAKPAEKKGGGE